MKRIILLIITIIMFIPSIVLASGLEVSSITPEYDTTKGITVTEDDSSVDFKVDYNASNQEVKYKIKISNPTSKRVKITNLTLSDPENGFLIYTFEGLSVDEYIKGNEHKEVVLSIKTNTTPVENGYDSDVLTLSISYEDAGILDIITNPPTGVKNIILLSLLIIVILSLTYINIKNKSLFKSINILVLVLISIISTKVIATDNNEIVLKGLFTYSGTKIEPAVLKPSGCVINETTNSIDCPTDTFRTEDYLQGIKTIIFDDEINVPSNAVDSWDIGVAQNGNVIAYTVLNGTTEYDLHIQSNTRLHANEDMSFWFYNFVNISEIKNIDLLYTKDTTDMSYLFMATGMGIFLDSGHRTIISDNLVSNKGINKDTITIPYTDTGFKLDLGEKFDTSRVTNMRGMFAAVGMGSTNFTLDLGEKFDTSKVTDMAGMFESAGYSNPIFTLNLGEKFDTSNVTNMESMFSFVGSSSTVFSLDLGSKFDTSKVTNMSSMFSFVGSSSTVFSLDLGTKFDTNKVTNMENMFFDTGYSSPVFTLNLGDKFDTSKVTNMASMFYETGYKSSVFTLNLGDKFDTSNVIDMNHMFYGTGHGVHGFDESYQMTSLDESHDDKNINKFQQASYSVTVFTLNLGDKFDTSKVTNMEYMFFDTGLNSSVFTLDLGDKFDTSNVTKMKYMFYETGYSNPIFTLNLGEKFDTSNVTNMEGMFYYTGHSSRIFTLNLGDNFDTSNVTNMKYMFYETGYWSPVFMLNLGDNFDTSNVTNMERMFDMTGVHSSVFTLDLGNKFNTSKVTDMGSMFYHTGYRSPVFTLNLGDNFDTSNVTNMKYMFCKTGYSNSDFTLNLGTKISTAKLSDSNEMYICN